MEFIDFYQHYSMVWIQNKIYKSKSRKRMRGISKYGTLKRLLFGIKDIIRVKKIIKEK